MKQYSMYKRLPLVALLLLGLASMPLVASADNDNRGRQSHSRHGDDHHRDYRPGRGSHHDNRRSYWRGYKHGYKNGYYNDRPYGYRGRYCNIHRRYYYEPHHDRVDFLFGLSSENLDIIFRD